RWRHEHGNPASGGLAQRRSDPGTRLCRTDQTARNHTDYYDGVVRLLLRSFEVRRLFPFLGAVSCFARDRPGFRRDRALNEVLEWKTDGNMRRTAQRPIPAGRFSLLHATMVGTLMMLGGAVYLGLALNPLTAWLALATSAVYLGAYTPLKKVHPICTFVGAFPGAMPGVLGWTAARAQLDWGALVMFAIVFFWQFPHFYSIAWLYRQDYEDGGIRMLPVVEPDGKSTGRQILIYSLALIPISLVPAYLGMAGKLYFAGALVLGIALFYVGRRLVSLKLATGNARSKQRARQLLQA